MINGKTVLITGGTGSFGKACTKRLLEIYNPKKIIIFSRDELKQFHMKNEIEDSRVDYFIGDVRDKDRLYRAFNAQVDIIIHAAALKQIPACERNPFEAVKTNILGAENIIEAAIDSNVSRVLALSTDKAAAPINLYGATKLASDKLFLAAYNYVGNKDTIFSVVRYGNVMGSRGSVIPLFLSKKESNVLPITDERMTRFNLTINEAIDFSLMSLKKMTGNELFVPKIPSYKITDVAAAINPNAQIEIIGLREGEKIHEELITSTESICTLEFEDHYIVYPSKKFLDKAKDFYDQKGITCKCLSYGECYNSENNSHFLSVDEIKSLIEHNL